MPYVDPNAFLSAVLHNGVGRFVCQLQRVTLMFCKEWGDSRGMREFIEHDLLDFARKNPGIVVYVQPRRHQRPKLHAEFLNGRVEDMCATAWPRENVIKFLDQLRCRSGVEIMRIRKDMKTETPSIQGPWNPFINQPTDWNVKTFPDPEGLKSLKYEKSATEIVLEMARAQGILNIVHQKDTENESKNESENESENSSGKKSFERENDQIVRPVTASISKS